MANLHITSDQTRKSRAIVVGLNTSMDAEKYMRSMKELTNLVEACDLEIVSQIVQNQSVVTHATFIGSGKVEYVRMEIDMFDADIVVFNETLTPMQVRNLEKEWDTEVLDRTGLILQIFSTRARTREAKLQVESARLQYMLPRLAGMRTELSRQGGGSGRLSNKGAGEQKLELDRRRIEHRISELRKELEIVDRERTTQRSRRLGSGVTRISLVGYTNAGKSTLLNTLLDAYGDDSAQSRKVLQKDMLFATLDTAVRRIEAPGHLPFLLTDTVGFVSDLPHSLVKAFRSTLEEAKYADLLLEVIDFSDPNYRDQIEVTAQTLQELGADDIPILYVYNKTDLAIEREKQIQAENSASKRPVPSDIPFVRGDSIYMAAGKGIGLEELLQCIDRMLGDDRTEMSVLVPYSDGSVLQEMRERTVLLSEDYTAEGTAVKLKCRNADAERYRKYRTK